MKERPEAHAMFPHALETFLDCTGFGISFRSPEGDAAKASLPCSRRRRGSGSGIARKIAHRPAHHVQPHLLDIRPLPDVLPMSQTVVEDAPFAVIASPNDREVFVLAVDSLPRQ